LIDHRPEPDHERRWRTLGQGLAAAPRATRRGAPPAFLMPGLLPSPNHPYESLTLPRRATSAPPHRRLRSRPWTKPHW